MKNRNPSLVSGLTLQSCSCTVMLGHIADPFHRMVQETFHSSCCCDPTSECEQNQPWSGVTEQAEPEGSLPDEGQLGLHGMTLKSFTHFSSEVERIERAKVC